MIYISQAMLIFLTVLTVTLIYFLAPILTPFLLGALLAYLTDPLVKWLEKFHIHHLLSVIIVFFTVLFGVLLFILMLIPLVQSQIAQLVDVFPKILAWVENDIMPHLRLFINMDNLKTTIPATISKNSWVFTTVIASSFTLIEWVINLILTPVVTFYLLRDWDKILATCKEMLPKKYKPTILSLTAECNTVLGGFFRGQLLVMLSLCFIYGIGLSLVGLQVGLIIGIIGGILSIVPYLGSLFVVVVASLTALMQFGAWGPLIWVFVVFIIGQALEGYVLGPYLIGERIGLHPVAVIFSVMAGGVLFGFFGVLLALPVAAVIMVLIRHATRHYFHVKA